MDEAVEEAKKVAEDEKADKDAIEKAGKELSDKIMPIGAKLYESADDDSKEGSEDEPKEDKKDEPIEGEVVEDDEKK